MSEPAKAEYRYLRNRVAFARDAGWQFINFRNGLIVKRPNQGGTTIFYGEHKITEEMMNEIHAPTETAMRLFSEASP